MADKEQSNTDDQIREIRRSIDELDEKLLGLLNERFALARKIGRRKAETGSRIVDKARETAMIEALVAKNRGGLDDDMVRRIFTEIIAVGRQAQAARTISYLGPEATFTHAAAQGYFGVFDRYLPQASIKDVFDEVEKGSSDYGVVPVENSIEGAVNHTLDLFPESSLHICAEIYLAISHDLLSVSGRMEEIKRIYSHPQTFAQCRKWLQMNLPNAERIECGSNAQAATRALADTGAAAIAGSQAGRFYDLSVVAPRIQDFVRNTTRFLVIGRGKIPPTGEDKTSIMFVTAHIPGALFAALEPLSQAGINMLKLESRPAKYENWSYVFFVDIEGHIEEQAVREALARMKTVCQFLKVIGSYPMDPQ
ncbi:MAG: prephenate dehydratase [Desulfosudaceae bacterium]